MAELRLIEEKMLLRRHYGELCVLSFLPVMKICMVCWNYLVLKKDYLPFLTDFDSPMDLLNVYLYYSPKTFRYDVYIPGLGDIVKDDKVSKSDSDVDVDDGDHEGGVEVMVTN